MATAECLTSWHLIQTLYYKYKCHSCILHLNHLTHFNKKNFIKILKKIVLSKSSLMLRASGKYINQKDINIHTINELDTKNRERAKTVNAGWTEKFLSIDYNNSKHHYTPQLLRSQSLKKLQTVDQNDDIDFAFAEPSEGLYTEIKARKLILRRYQLKYQKNMLTEYEEFFFFDKINSISKKKKKKKITIFIFSIFLTFLTKIYNS